MTDVLHLLRAGTAEEHESLERTLDLLDPDLDRSRLTGVLTRMHGFWQAAEAALDDWAARFPDDAGAVTWSARRRAGLFAADLDALGAAPAEAVPALPPVTGTDDALGRLYVLEGSTLGGTFIDRHLAALPALAGVRLRAFSPYGSDTGAMWHAFRRTTRDRVADGGDADAMLSAATGTFRVLAQWCGPSPPPDRSGPSRRGQSWSRSGAVNRGVNPSSGSPPSAGSGPSSSAARS